MFLWNTVNHLLWVHYRLTGIYPSARFIPGITEHFPTTFSVGVCSKSPGTNLILGSIGLRSYIDRLWSLLSLLGGMWKRSWLRHYATSRKVAGSIPDVIGFFIWPNPSSRTMALRSTQPLTEMSTRNLPGGKGRPVRGDDNLTAIYEPIV
jgi:hypothetical protein